MKLSFSLPPTVISGDGTRFSLRSQIGRIGYHFGAGKNSGRDLVSVNHFTVPWTTLLRYELQTFHKRIPIAAANHKSGVRLLISCLLEDLQRIKTTPPDHPAAKVPRTHASIW